MRRLFAPALLVAGASLCLALGCSRQEREYPQTAREGFIASCMEAAREKLAENHDAQKDTEEQARVYCECSLRKVMVRIPYDEFAKFDKAIRSGSPIDQETAQKLQATVTECQAEAAKSK